MTTGMAAVTIGASAAIGMSEVATIVVGTIVGGIEGGVTAIGRTATRRDTVRLSDRVIELGTRATITEKPILVTAVTIIREDVVTLKSF
jgi:hypothetical protein